MLDLRESSPSACKDDDECLLRPERRHLSRSRKNAAPAANFRVSGTELLEDCVVTAPMA